MIDSRRPPIAPLAVLIGAWLSVGACASVDFDHEEDPPPSSACVSGGCDVGEICLQGVCVTPLDPVARDAGPTDAGRDAGPPSDAGEPAMGLACSAVFVDVAVGADAACALTDDGAVWCWGLDQCDQLGADPDPGRSSATPVRVAAPPLVQLAEHVDDHTCGLDAMGRLYCWGCDYDAMLAGHTDGPGVPFDAQIYQDVAATWAGTCTVRDDGTLACFGWDYNGQLGGCAPSGSTDNRCPTPVAFGAPTDFTRVSIHQRHGCGISGGQVHCWGKNDVGQLGRGFASSSEPLGPEPVEGSLSAVADVTVGINHACAIDAGGDLYCWGHNVHGQLGLGDHQRRNTPELVGAGYRRVRAGINQTCAIDVDGALFCWGRNGGGRLGVGDELERSSPTRVDGPRTYVAVGSGGSSSCGVRSDGRVLCWGLNDEGKLGVGSDDDELEVHTPRPIACAE